MKQKPPNAAVLTRQTAMDSVRTNVNQMFRDRGSVDLIRDCERSLVFFEPPLGGDKPS